jgi:hypothetical protein
VKTLQSPEELAALDTLAEAAAEVSARLAELRRTAQGLGWDQATFKFDRARQDVDDLTALARRMAASVRAQAGTP